MIKTTVAASDLWGISGGDFMAAYSALAVLVLAGLLWQRRRALGGRATGNDPQPDLGVYRLAMLNGGPQLAITTAIATLHAQGILRDGGKRKTLVAEGEPHGLADPLEREVVAAVQRTPGIAIAALRKQLADGDPIERVTSELTQAGLLVQETAADRVRWWWRAAALLAVLGIGRLFTDDAYDVMSNFLFASVFVVVAAAFGTRRRLYVTRRGRSFVTGQRSARGDLRTAAPAHEMGQGVALFGGAMLWMTQPALAATLGVPRKDAAAWGSSSCGSGGGCGGGWGGGGDGGGGSGGGDGGGGGGCGGGGCGGGGG